MEDVGPRKRVVAQFRPDAIVKRLHLGVAHVFFAVSVIVTNGDRSILQVAQRRPTVIKSRRCKSRKVLAVIAKRFCL